MSKPTPVAGGFFLVLPIIIGFFWGLSYGRAAQGVIAGLALGAVLAIGLWLFERARRGR